MKKGETKKNVKEGGEILRLCLTLIGLLFPPVIAEYLQQYVVD